MFSGGRRSMLKRIEELENRVAKLERMAGVPSSDSDGTGVSSRVMELMSQGKKIAAIKAYRQETGVGLKEAKEALIDAFEREYLVNLLERSGGKVAPAAREAGLNRKYFYDLLKKHGLQRSDT